MCGITGMVTWQEDVARYQADLKRMQAVLSNRGPDQQGMYQDTHCEMAHGRLQPKPIRWFIMENSIIHRNCGKNYKKKEQFLLHTVIQKLSYRHTYTGEQLVQSGSTGFLHLQSGSSRHSGYFLPVTESV